MCVGSRRGWRFYLKQQTRVAIPFLLTSAPVAAGPFLVDWNHRFGISDTQSAASVAVGPADRCAITGDFRGSVDFGGGVLQNSLLYEDVFVAVFDADGGHLWSHRFGDSGFQFGSDVAMDSDSNVVITGQFDGSMDFGGGPHVGLRDVFLAKFDANGQYLWSHAYGEPYPAISRGVAVTTDDGNHVYLTGFFSGTIFFGGDSLSSGDTSFSDAFIVEFDPDGNHLWSKSYGFSSGDNEGVDVAVDATGNVVVVGNSTGTTPSAGDMFILKYDGAGTQLWSKRLGYAAHRSASVAFDSGDNIVWTGTFSAPIDFGGGSLMPHSGSSDVFVAKFDHDGNHLWSKSYGGSEPESANGLAIDASDQLVVCGVFRDSTNLGGATLTGLGWPDIFLLRLDNTGNHIYSAAFGDEELDLPGRPAMTPSGAILATGEFRGSIDFGNGALTSTGLEDIFLVKLHGGTTVSTPELGRASSGLEGVRASGATITVDYVIGPGVESVELTMFDVRGRIVRGLYRGPDGPGPHSRSWVAHDQRGRRLSSGIYLFRMRTDTEVFSQKLLVVQ